MPVFWSLVWNSVVLAVYLLFSVACFFTVHEHYLGIRTMRYRITSTTASGVRLESSFPSCYSRVEQCLPELKIWERFEKWLGFKIARYPAATLWLCPVAPPCPLPAVRRKLSVPLGCAPSCFAEYQAILTILPKPPPECTHPLSRLFFASAAKRARYGLFAVLEWIYLICVFQGTILYRFSM